MLNRLFCIAISFITISTAFAQDWEKGELESVEIEIINQRQIELPPASRSFEKIPPKPAEVSKQVLQYDFRPFSFQTSQINPAIKPLRLKDQQSSELFGGYLSLGYGNFASPYVEGFINSKKDKNKLVGAHVFLNTSGRGPVDGRNSGGGNTGISLYGKTFNDYVSVAGDIKFENRTTNFYGYPSDALVDRTDIRQFYNQFSLSGELSNTKNKAFTYSLGGAFSYLADRYNATETEADILFNSSYKINDESSIALNGDYAIITRKDSLIDATPRSLFNVRPSYIFYPVEDLRMSVGVLASFENDSIDNKDVHAYPDIRATYPLSPSVDVVAALTGGIEKVSLQTLSRENLWLGPNVSIFHTNKLLDLQAALHTRLGNKVSINGGFSLASLRNLYFHVNDSSDRSKFNVEYDKGTVRRTNLFASIGYAQTETVKVLLRGDLFSYDADQQEQAWHRPTYKVTGDVSFNVARKLLLDFNLIAMGGMKAKVYQADRSFRTVDVDAALDLNARAEYLFSDKISFFLQFNNIANNEYPVFLNYPVRGFQAIGGLTWNF